MLRDSGQQLRGPYKRLLSGDGCSAAVVRRCAKWVSFGVVSKARYVCLSCSGITYLVLRSRVRANQPATEHRWRAALLFTRPMPSGASFSKPPPFSRDQYDHGGNRQAGAKTEKHAGEKVHLSSAFR
jgi:hypothetical protein